jgi:hypothetical protein
MDLRCIVFERMDFELSGAPHGRVPLTEQFLTTSRIVIFPRRNFNHGDSYNIPEDEIQICTVKFV